MRRKVVKFVFLAFAFLVLTALASVSEAKTIYVPDDYEKIQWAVDNATAGDTIIVRDGIYYEHVNVNKQLTLKSENGSANCIVDARYSGSPITLNADGISIEGLTLRNSSWPNAGIKVYSNNNSITDNYISNNGYGISLDSSSNNNITDNYISSNNGDGIDLWGSSNNRITGNNISNNDYGIFLWYSSNNRITDNYISNNGYGIRLEDSSNNRITDNYISNNGYGISLDSSSNNSITSNYISSNNGYGIDLWDSSNNLSASASISSTFGIRLEDSSNNRITDNYISNNYWDGIRLSYSSNNSITDNNISNNKYGISLWYSSNNRIRNNIFINDGVVIVGYELKDWNTHVIENNTVNGRPLYYFKDRVGGKVPEDAGQVILANCTGFLLENLNISNTNGIIIGFSSQNIITNNYISNNWYGIYLDDSSNNRIAGNNISSNNWWPGVYLRYSSNNSITDNYISSNNGYGIDLWGSSNNRIADNYISNNDEGIYMWDSSNNSITSNYISNNDEGIQLDCSGNNSITDNYISNNDYGIDLWWDSSNNRIAGNNISSNNWYGIYLDDSSNNSIYLNNFIDNRDDVYSYYSANVWNSTEEMTYTYNGKTYTSYLGNYWSDYTGSDADGDGIGDTPYSINGDKDYHPLIIPFENYIEKKPVLTFTDLTPSTITTNQAPYQATLSAKGSNFYNVTQIIFEWSGNASGSATWNKGDENWNAKVIIHSDSSMTLKPVVVESNPTWSGTCYWTVTLKDNTGATASKQFTVIYSPTPALIRVVDFSAWQGSISEETFRKLKEEQGVTHIIPQIYGRGPGGIGNNSYLKSQVKNATSAGMEILGGYVFPSSKWKEALDYWNENFPYLQLPMLALDVEPGSLDATVKPEHIEGVKKHGVIPLIYSSKYEWEEVMGGDPNESWFAENNIQLWVASWDYDGGEWNGWHDDERVNSSTGYLEPWSVPAPWDDRADLIIGWQFAGEIPLYESEFDLSVFLPSPIPNQPPTASFTYSPQNPVVGEEITFDASDSYDPDGSIVFYEWDFGDGNITNTTEEVIKHSYSEAGSYEVVLTVTDDNGANNSTTKMITVVPAPPSVSISTDKYEYTAGDVMLINITLTNPRNEWQNVKFLWRLDIPDYNLSFTVINNKSLLLPPEFKKTFVISWRLPKLRASFNASWYVALYDGVISEDTADWRYVGATKKGERDIAIAEYLREIERSALHA